MVELGQLHTIPCMVCYFWKWDMLVRNTSHFTDRIPRAGCPTTLTSLSCCDHVSKWYPLLCKKEINNTGKVSMLWFEQYLNYVFLPYADIWCCCEHSELRSLPVYLRVIVPSCSVRGQAQIMRRLRLTAVFLIWSPPPANSRTSSRSVRICLYTTVHKFRVSKI